MYGRLEALIATAVHIPQLKDVSNYCCTNRDVQFSAAHSKISLHDFRVVDRGMNDQHQINLSVPFEVRGARFVRLSLRFRYRYRRLNSRDNHIPELVTLAVEGSRMPAQAAVHERVRDNFPVGGATREGEVLHPQHLLLMYCPGHDCEFMQCGAVQMKREFAR